MATKGSTSRKAKGTEHKSSTSKKSTTAAPEKPAPASKGAAPAATSHEFSLMAPEASEVYLVGDFNNWENGTDKMRRLKSGLHKKSKKLKPGRYEYRFVVDGQWWSDPVNEQRCHNGFGEENSVIEIR